MSGSRRYVLDANVFIEAKNRYYGFNLCPGLWKALIREHKDSRVFSIDKVLDELIAEGDHLSVWAKDAAPGTFFKKTQEPSCNQRLSGYGHMGKLGIAVHAGSQS